VLDPLGAGVLAARLGHGELGHRQPAFGHARGQGAEVVTWVTTCEGKHGSFVFRARIEHLQAGNGYHIGTGTWNIIRGTGVYAGITGVVGSPTRGSRADRDPGPNAEKAS
jgi:hypothetical protein